MKIRKYVLGALGTNCYFLIDEDTRKTLVIDPADNADFLLREIRADGLDAEAIVLTHAHADHMLALNGLHDGTGAPLLVHEADADRVFDPVLNLSQSLRMPPCEPFPIGRILHDNDTIEFGPCEARVLHTPGHTPGSICLLCGDDLISGDTLFRESMGRCDFSGGDGDAMARSLRRLMTLEDGVRIYPGHGIQSDICHERQYNQFIRRL